MLNFELFTLVNESMVNEFWVFHGNTPEEIDKEVEKHKENAEKYKEKLGNFSPSSWIKTLHYHVSVGDVADELHENPGMDKSADYSRSFTTGVDDDAKIAKLNLKLKDADPKEKKEIKNQIKEIEKERDSKSERAKKEICYVALEAAKKLSAEVDKDKSKGKECANKFKEAMKTYCKQNNIDIDIDSLLKQ